VERFEVGVTKLLKFKLMSVSKVLYIPYML
jgi:hypothetical protein